MCGWGHADNAGNVKPMPSHDSTATDSQTNESFSDFTDIETFTRYPRLSSIAVAPGGRIVAAIAQGDEHGSKLVSSLWELSPERETPARRLTFSKKGESAPRFAPDGALLFSSARPDPSGEAPEDTPAIWRLPEHGEAHVVASAPGGIALAGIADDGTILATTSVRPGTSLEDDGEARKSRKDAKNTTIWHTGMPIRFWDRELGDASPRLVIVSDDGELVDLAPDADTVNLHGASADISPDGSTVASTWSQRITGGRTTTSVVLIDVATGERTTFLSATPEQGYGGASFSPDGTQLAVVRRTAGTPTDTSYAFLEIHPVPGTDAASGEVITVDVGDLTLGGLEWSADGTLLISGDLHSSGAILAVDPKTGQVRTLADDAVYSSLAAASDGSLLALRTDVGTPARPVRLGASGHTQELLAPGGIDELPGTLEFVSTEVDGVTVNGWLCIPHGASADNPAPVMLWVHGGPHASYNAWSWRWCPWLSVARGYAVLMPDPAMSTGYGHEGLNRGWPRLPDVVFNECETLLDAELKRPELDGSRTAMLGASFGGFMANWIAGHTDRFDAIVTHAGLWALDQQHRTTDAAAGKMRVHGHEQDESQWYRAYSPHHSAEQITTPVLITHGNRDYRVPVSEALRMWWDLVSGWDGEPDTMPHRFLQVTSENHWILTPSNSYTWNQAVLAFCDQHVLGGEKVPNVLPW